MEKKPNVFVTKLGPEKKDLLQKKLQDQGFELTWPPYTHFQAKKKGISLTFYESGKLVVQGKDKHDFIIFFLEPEILESTDYSYVENTIDYEERIGVDEAGKGDYFGPLCIAAVYANSKQEVENLIKLGAIDSKRMKDTKIASLAAKIKKDFKFVEITIFPKRYNELYTSFKNLNSLLAWAHASCIEELAKKTGCKKAIIDQFAGEHVVLNALKKKNLSIDLIQRHRGEEDVIVAAASILARANFIQSMKTLGDRFNTILPLGASALVKEKAQSFIYLHGKSELKHVAKLHFKTTGELIS